MATRESAAKSAFEEASEEQSTSFRRRSSAAWWISPITSPVSVCPARPPGPSADVDPAKADAKAAGPLAAGDRLGAGEGGKPGNSTWTIGMWGTEAMAAEARIVAGGVLGTDREGLLPRGCWTRSPGGAPPVSRSTVSPGLAELVADRPAACPRRGCRSVADDRREAALAWRRRPQHPQLRDLHLPRLARHRGKDQLQRAAVPPTAPSIKGVELTFDGGPRRQGDRRPRTNSFWPSYRRGATTATRSASSR